MKKTQMFLRMLFLSALLCSMTSCDLLDQLKDLDDDDDDKWYEGVLPDELLSGTLADAPFEEYAVKFIINNDDEIGSIELMASGTYLILPPAPENTRAESSAQPFSLFKRNGRNTRSIGYEGLFGDFDIESDGRFILHGFGWIRFTGTAKLEIAEDGGDVREVSTSVYYPKQGDDLNRRFCRTWHPIYAVDITGHVYSQSELNEEFVKYVLVSRTCEDGNYIGTFSRVETDNTPAGNGYWGWYNKPQQIFKFVYAGEDLDQYSIEQVYFENEYAYFFEAGVIIKCEEYRR